ncbi:hypothetical protein [Streptomyces sp. NPDC054961]
MQLNSVGVGCVDVRIPGRSGKLLEASTITVTGTFTGLASTLLSQYSGSGTIRYDFTDGTHRTDHYTAACPVGALAVSPLVGTIQGGPEDGAILEMTPTPVNTNPLGPVKTIAFTELACSRGQLGGGGSGSGTGSGSGSGSGSEAGEGGQAVLD